MAVEHAVITVYVAIWVGLSAVAAAFGKRGVLSWTAAVAWTASACVLTVVATWTMSITRRITSDGADPVTASDLWAIYLVLVLWVTPFAYVAARRRTCVTARGAGVAVAVAAAAGLVITHFHGANPDELIFLTTRNDRPDMAALAGFALTVIGLVLVSRVDRQSHTRHVGKLVATATVFGGAALSTSMGGMLLLAWLQVVAATVVLVIAAIRADRRRPPARVRPVGESRERTTSQ